MKIKIRRDGIGEAHWSDKEISIESNVSRPSITRWRNNVRQPSYEKVKEIEDTTGLPFDALVGKSMTTDRLKEIERRLLLQVSNIQKIIDEIGDAELLYSKEKTETSKDLLEND